MGSLSLWQLLKRGRALSKWQVSLVITHLEVIISMGSGF